MKEIVIVSGKGGTGKTSIVASFAALAKNAVLADCDVDAADLHLVLAPRIQRTVVFRAGKQATIRQEDCVQCGACLARCRFDAVAMDGDTAGEAVFSIDPISCEGCGVCVEFCPVDAIDFDEVACGKWFVSETRCGPIVHARLGVASENSGKLVTAVRNEARDIAKSRGADYVLVDGPPGIGCPVIASLTGADLVVAVTEPTLSGKHDLERVVSLATSFKIPVAICINKSDLNTEWTAAISSYAQEHGLPVVANIRYDATVTEAQVAGKAVIEYTQSAVASEIKAAWDDVVRVLHGGGENE